MSSLARGGEALAPLWDELGLSLASGYLPPMVDGVRRLQARCGGELDGAVMAEQKAGPYGNHRSGSASLPSSKRRANNRTYFSSVIILARARTRK